MQAKIDQPIRNFDRQGRRPFPSATDQDMQPTRNFDRQGCMPIHVQLVPPNQQAPETSAGKAACPSQVQLVPPYQQTPGASTGKAAGPSQELLQAEVGTDTSCAHVGLDSPSAPGLGLEQQFKDLKQPDKKKKNMIQSICLGRQPRSATPPCWQLSGHASRPS
jgi:hypothetical protein